MTPREWPEQKKARFCAEALQAADIRYSSEFYEGALAAVFADLESMQDGISEMVIRQCLKHTATMFVGRAYLKKMGVTL